MHLDFINYHEGLSHVFLKYILGRFINPLRSKNKGCQIYITSKQYSTAKQSLIIEASNFALIIRNSKYSWHFVQKLESWFPEQLTEIDD